MGNNGGNSVSDFLKNQMEQQKMQFVQQWADQKNPPVCPSILQEKRQSCGDFSGDINRDMNMCHAKGCCFDAIMWNSANNAAEKEAQASNTRTSPFRTASQSARPSFSTALSGSRSNFAPS